MSCMQCLQARVEYLNMEVPLPSSWQPDARYAKHPVYPVQRGPHSASLPRHPKSSHVANVANMLLPASVGLGCAGASRRAHWRTQVRRFKKKHSRPWRARCDCSACPENVEGPNSGDADDSKGEGKDAADVGEMDDASFSAAFRKRAQEVEQQEMERRVEIEKNWQEGRADVKVGAVADDWVRRVSLSCQEIGLDCRLACDSTPKIDYASK